MSAFIDLVALLDLERTGPDTFIGANPLTGPERLFGGHVLGQALRAAIHTTTEDRRPDSLHAYFIRAGRLEEPITYQVTRTRDGRSFSTRQVTAIQDGKAILILATSFHIDEPGVDWQQPTPFAAGELDSLPPVQDGHMSWSAFEIRSPGPRTPDEFPVRHPVWLRTRQPMPDDPIVHLCVLASMSDVAVAPSGRGSYDGPAFAGASLDHALWIHRPCRVDEWLRIETTAVSNSASLGLTMGGIHAADGSHVASLGQGVLIRSINS
jgi:acyl-CoA thioesterase-2